MTKEPVGPEISFGFALGAAHILGRMEIFSQQLKAVGFQDLGDEIHSWIARLLTDKSFLDACSGDLKMDSGWRRRNEKILAELLDAGMEHSRTTNQECAEQ